MTGAVAAPGSAANYCSAYPNDPLDQWIPDKQQFGGRIFKRTVVGVEGWAEVPR